MPTTHHTLRTPALLAGWRAVEDSAQRLQRHLQQLVQRQQQRRQARAREQLMQSLDDRTLRDLGVTRSELPSLAHDPLDATRARNVRSA